MVAPAVITYCPMAYIDDSGESDSASPDSVCEHSRLLVIVKPIVQENIFIGGIYARQSRSFVVVLVLLTTAFAFIGGPGGGVEVFSQMPSAGEII